VLLRFAGNINDASRKFKPMLSKALLQSIVALIPDEWLESEPFFKSVSDHREAYLNFLMKRLESSNIFEKEVARARIDLV
jgi:hypothetical protein